MVMVKIWESVLGRRFACEVDSSDSKVRMIIVVT